MWNKLVTLILRYRVANLIMITLLTVFMGYHALKVQLSYDLVKMLPGTDSTNIEYDNFKKLFGEDGNVFVVGINDKKINNLDVFNDWYNIGNNIKSINGVEEVISIGRIYNLTKNENIKKFEFKKIINSVPKTQNELDSLLKLTKSLPFYEGFVYNKNSDATLMLITLDKKKLNTKNRVALIQNIKQYFENFENKDNVKVHYSGLPYIRTITSLKVESELKLFMILAIIITSLILLLIFKSAKAIIFPMIILIISVIWALGSLSLFGYKITMLTGIIPPLLILIGVENCIYILNKYHIEYKNHGNKIKALTRVIQRTGKGTFMTNATTASGFITFAFTHSAVLVEFGIIATLNIMLEYMLSIFLVPIFYSFLAPPKERHIKHLEYKLIVNYIEKVVNLVLKHRKAVYFVTTILIVAGIIGMTKLTTTGNIVDDIPKKDPIYQDLMFFESNFKGIMPFEISIDTQKKNGVMKLSTIQKIQQLQDTLSTYPEFSKPLSLAEIIKSATQSYFNGNASEYRLPDSQEANFILAYIPKIKGQKNAIHSLLDSNKRITRISVQMKNIGTNEIKRIKENLKPKIDSIFNPAKFKVILTGTSVVFLKGTEYLVGNLIESIFIAIVIIAILMALLFSSFRMVIVILITNLFPQLLTAGLMGYFGIHIKPTTILIFSIAYGISVDNAIIYLLRYRHEINTKKTNIFDAVVITLREAGHSMFSSSVVLFLGFAIFIASSFGGTVSLGILVSFTLFVAMFANFIILPSLIITFHKSIVTKSFEKPLLKMEEELD
ncbi:MAG: MMPL family transporter [Bacteroidota bacterium]|nr:MMPL family transporter [Bacteroidota bacterium]